MTGEKMPVTVLVERPLGVTTSSLSPALTCCFLAVSLSSSISPAPLGALPESSVPAIPSIQITPCDAPPGVSRTGCPSGVATTMLVAWLLEGSTWATSSRARSTSTASAGTLSVSAIVEPMTRSTSA